MTKIDKEKKILKFMICYYCKKIHKKNSICDECNNVLEYAKHKLDACIFGNTKGRCRNCSIHCFSAQQRTKIKKIMRFVGPRMIVLEPIRFLKKLAGLAQ